jgi:hypothetical protein
VELNRTFNTYHITSLPLHGKLFVVTPVGNIATTLSEDNVHIALPTNLVAYRTKEPIVGDQIDSFTFTATDAQSQSVTVRMWISTQEPPFGSKCLWYDCNGICNGRFENCYGCDDKVAKSDSCGVCGGDDTSCACITNSYRSYSTSELDRILINWQIENSLQLIDHFVDTLEKTIDKLDYVSPENSAIDIGDAVETIQSYNKLCLSNFKQMMDSFLQEMQNA